MQAPIIKGQEKIYGGLAQHLFRKINHMEMA